MKILTWLRLQTLITILFLCHAKLMLIFADMLLVWKPPFLKLEAWNYHHNDDLCLPCHSLLHHSFIKRRDQSSSNKNKKESHCNCLPPGWILPNIFLQWQLIECMYKSQHRQTRKKDLSTQKQIQMIIRKSISGQKHHGCMLLHGKIKKNWISKIQIAMVLTLFRVSSK